MQIYLKNKNMFKSGSNIKGKKEGNLKKNLKGTVG